MLSPSERQRPHTGMAVSPLHSGCTTAAGSSWSMRYSHSLTSIDGDFVIAGNDNLATLNGLENLYFIGGSLSIGWTDWEDDPFGNPLLSSIAGLAGLSCGYELAKHGWE